jgi:hypothetical protein
MITLFDHEGTVGQKSLANIPLNYASQGQMFYSDLDIHMEIMTSNEKIEIFRSYLSLLDVMSNMGG